MPNSIHGKLYCHGVPSLIDSFFVNTFPAHIGGRGAHHLTRVKPMHGATCASTLAPISPEGVAAPHAARAQPPLRSVRLGAQENFLPPPVGSLGHVDLVLRRTRD